MRFTGTCWSCAMALAAGYIPGSRAGKEEKRGERRPRHRKSNKERLDRWPILPVAQKVERKDSDHEQPLRQSAGQPVHGLAPTSIPTSSSAAAVSAPKTTEGPYLVGRKMGTMRWDVIHDGFLGQKRDGGVCSQNYSLCPSSLSGGCCPSNMMCDTSSCLPSSAGQASACGVSGYFACDVANGAGCCPTGYLCVPESCSPSPGVTSVLSCPAGEFLCPASLGGNCCKNGMGCGIGACYSTNPVTFTLTELFTTTDASSNTITFTSTITSTTVEGAPNPTQTVGTGGAVPKISASATPVAKIPATSTSTDSGSGLPTAALGGIIGGAIFFLTAILIAAIFIIRGLNRASKAQELANSRASSRGPRSGRSGQARPPLVPDMETMSVDPLMMTHSQSGIIRRQSGVSSPHSTAHEMEGSGSPPFFHSPFSPRSPPHTHYPRGYNPVASSDSHSNSSGGYRHPSLDTSPPSHHNPNAGYFDLPIQQNQRASLVSSQGRRPSQHGRNWSNVSDQSQVSQTSSAAAELDAGKDGSRKSSQADGEQKSSMQRLMQGMSRMVSRRRSDPVVLTGGPKRTEWSSSPRERLGLGFIAEAGESKLQIDANQQDLVTSTPQAPPFQDISLVDQPRGFRAS